ncbi:hypothetical protein ASE94_10525 [Devosia sp. Leaf64]|nr:hypothetical protein ASE94_10525 [Devosia sp. Leaf64]
MELLMGETFVLDMGTLIIARIITFVMFAAGITIMTLRRSRPETVLFCWGLLCGICAWVTAMFSRATGNDWVIIAYAGFVSANVSFQWAALSTLTERRVKRVWFFIPPAVSMVLVAIIGRDISTAAFVTSAVLCVQYAVLAWFIVTLGPTAVQTRTSILMALAYAVAFVAAAGRFAGEFLWPDLIANPMAPVPAVTLPFLGAYIGTILITLSWVAALKDRAEDALANLAFRDELTGLANRRRFYALGERLFASAQRDGRNFSLILLDIDHFKSVNDRFGHEEGDRVLASVARNVQKLAPEAELSARVGGEEFCLVFPGTDAVGAQRYSERLRDLVASSVTLPNGEAVRFSAGIAQASDEDAVLADVYRRADKALYAAKADGRDCAVISRVAA